MLAVTQKQRLGLQIARLFHSTGSVNSIPGQAESSEDEQQQARRWLSKLNAQTIPRHVGEISFSRSSGPGGQNVNKVNSKATLKVPVESLQSMIPSLIFPRLLDSTYYAKRTGALVFQDDTSRKQNDNIEGCWTKLYEVFQDAAKEVVVGETSPEQAAKVKEL